MVSYKNLFKKPDRLTEREIERIVVAQLKRAGGLVMKVPNEATFKRRVPGTQVGAPDLVVAFPKGVVVFVEVKSQNGRLTPAQSQVFDRLSSMGHMVTVIRRPAEVLDLIERVQQMQDKAGDGGL